LNKGEVGKHKGRSKKWKQMLKLPHISQCINIKQEIGVFSIIKFQNNNLLRVLILK
jgi:hypothetical protein